MAARERNSNDYPKPKEDVYVLWVEGVCVATFFALQPPAVSRPERQSVDYRCFRSLNNTDGKSSKIE